MDAYIIMWKTIYFAVCHQNITDELPYGSVVERLKLLGYDAGCRRF